jgi:membrane protease YdiL (CAAX protease family)
MRRLAVRTSLYISIGFIFILWSIKVIRNTVFINRVLAQFESIPQVFLESFITAIAVILSATLLLRLSREKLGDIGFTRVNILKQLRNGFFLGVLIFILDTFLISPITDALLPETSAQGIDKSKLFSNTSYIFTFLFIGLFKGGFSEELWRTFILTRFEKLSGRAGLIFALIASSLIFGVGHLYQGLSGMISISIIGFLYALVYLRKRLALEAVFAHSTENLISIILGYAIYAGK